MLPWCIALSAAVHVLLLTVAASSAPRAGGLAHGGRRSAGAISVRLLPDAAAPRAQVPALAPAIEAAELHPALPPASAPEPESTPAAAPQPEEAASVATGQRSAPGDSAEGGYVPRPLLTVAPAANTPVVIAMPPGPVEIGRRVGVLALYIDEQGRVRRIEAEPPPLPRAMEQAARDAFSAARFSPGQVDGRVVRSRIRVEVTFDAGSLPAAPAASAASGASAAGAASAADAAPRPSAARAASGTSGARAGSAQRSR